MDGKVQETEGRARQAEADVEAKYDSYKAATRKTLADAQDSTEHLYEKARSMTDRKATEALSDVEKKGEEVKASWSNWLGWGKSKAEQPGKRGGAGKLADTGEQRADKQRK